MAHIAGTNALAPSGPRLLLETFKLTNTPLFFSTLESKLMSPMLSPLPLRSKLTVPSIMTHSSHAIYSRQWVLAAIDALPSSPIALPEMTSLDNAPLF